MLNADDVRGRVLLVDRGVVPLVNKVLIAQAAGAVGVVIADDGNLHNIMLCSLFTPNQVCLICIIGFFDMIYDR